MNLLEVLSQEDKDKITRYVSYYGGANGEFIGVDTWLEDWAKANRKLYKLLGNQLIVRVPYSYKKSETHIINDLRELFQSHLGIELEDEFVAGLRDLKHSSIITEAQLEDLRAMFYPRIYNRDKIDFNVKVKYENKSLQLQSGMKLIRALGKCIEWYRKIRSTDKFCTKFEEFRIRHSRIYNEEVNTSELVISIHPMDYLTMSDNNCNWTSCMNWINNGCYHVGTIEMMNSNVTLCCYLESKTVDFTYQVFDNKEDTWNSKKWRQLVYVNKDIILAGKAYPFSNEDLTKDILKTIKDLAKKNMNWDYTYGPEVYGDMLGINSLEGMNRIRKMLPQSVNRHIFIDTNAMYNDLLNDSNFTYWCYRNKPKKSYILKVSGKAPCVACGNSVIETENWDEGYNGRYQAENTVCEDCLAERQCYMCGNKPLIGKKEMWIIEDKYGSRYKLCKEHIKECLTLCPCCNKTIRLPIYRREVAFGAIEKRELKNLEEIELQASYNNAKNCWIDNLIHFYHIGAFVPVILCEDCLKNYGYTTKKVSFTPRFDYLMKQDYNIITKPLKESDDWIKKYCNLDSFVSINAEEFRGQDIIYLSSAFEYNDCFS